MVSSLQVSQRKQMTSSETWSSQLESNDSETMKEVQASHAPDGRKVDVKPILHVIDSILLCPKTTIPDAPTGTREGKATLEEKSLADSVDPLRSAAPIIDALSHQLISYTKVSITTENGIKRPLMTCMCPAGDEHARAILLLKTVKSYSWDAKVLLTVAAFAVNYGEFFLLAQSEAKNSRLSQSMALLKQLREFTEGDRSSQAKTEAVIELLKLIMGVTKCVVDLNHQSTKSANDPVVTNAVAHFPKAAYWTILSVVTCASHVSFSPSGFQELTTESVLEKISSLTAQGKKIQSLLTNQLSICKEQIQDKDNKEYLKLVIISTTPQEDNLVFLKALFCHEDGRQYLVDNNNTQIRIEELKGRHVLVLVSSLDVSNEEMRTLKRLYMESKEKGPEFKYQVVWVTVVDSWGIEERQKFENLKSKLPWYMVADPSKIKPGVIQYLKKKWQFHNKMIVVPIDPKGVEQSLNALDMLWIWGNDAFPFTKEREEALWGTQNWTLKLILGSFDRTTLDWMEEGKAAYVCYYGGEDIDWIKEFTSSAKEAITKNIPQSGLQMVYVGKSNSMKHVQKVIDTIKAERLSNYFTDPTAISFFWTRLESILYLKMLSGKNLKNDPIMREVTALLSYDSGDKGWALFCKGPTDLVLGRGDGALKSMKEFDKWREGAVQDGNFLAAAKDYMEKSAPKQQCGRIILTGSSRREIPSKELRADQEIDCALEKSFVYRYCVAD